MIAEIPIQLSPWLRDGELIRSNDPLVVLVGTRPLTYVEMTVNEITIDVFGESFLRSIGAWLPTSFEVLLALRGEVVPWLSVFCAECSGPFDRRSFDAAHNRESDGERVHEGCCPDVAQHEGELIPF